MFKFKNGYVLVEVVVALAIITTAFLSLIALLNNSIGLARVVSDNYIATYLAAEGIEIVKNIIDTNILTPGQAWNSGLANGTYEVEYNSAGLNQNQNRFLQFNPLTNIYSYSGGNLTSFKRRITIQNFNDAIKVISVIEWTSRGGVLSKIQLEDFFYRKL